MTKGENVKRQNRPQNAKPRDLGRVRSIQELRRSNATGPIPSGARYDRNAFRVLAQRGRWDDDDIYEV
jgi:hypothetical protein